MTRRYYIIGSAIAAVLLFQLFFRYGYVRQSNAVVWRVDRLTGSTCVMPCVPRPTPRPTAEPTPFQLDVAKYDFREKVEAANQRAIALARNAQNAAQVVATANPGYVWKAGPSGLYGDLEPSEILHDTTFVDTTRLVCYCNAKDFGWRWEVHVDTGLAYFIDDNGDLMKKYHLDSTPPPYSGKK